MTVSNLHIRWKRSSIVLISTVLIFVVLILRDNSGQRTTSLSRVILEDVQEPDAFEEFDNKELKGKSSPSLGKMFEKIHSDPDVKPVKGAYKVLSAIQGLGSLPDLSLNPHKKKESAIVSVARSKSSLDVVVGSNSPKATTTALDVVGSNQFTFFFY